MPKIKTNTYFCKDAYNRSGVLPEVCWWNFQWSFIQGGNVRIALFHLLLFLWVTLWMAGAAQAEIVLLLSDNKPSVINVAQSLQNVAGVRLEVFNLGGDRSRAVEMVTAIQSTSAQQVVAVGLLAAQVARQYLSSRQVVFCQVLNYEDYDLVTSWMKGVSAIPSMQIQFRVWKTLDPGLKRVGVISSRQMRESIDGAAAAARLNDIELVRFEVASDREIMAALRQMSSQIQGLWLAPDSRVLSAAIIREMVTYASRQDIHVLAFSQTLLKEGALLSGTPDNEDIARAVIARLKQAQGMKTIPGDALMPLSSATMSINSKISERQGLTISEKLREFANVE